MKELKLVGATIFYLIYTIPTMIFVISDGSLIRMVLGTFSKGCRGYGDYGGAMCIGFGIMFAGLQLLLLIGEVFATLWYIKCLKSNFEFSVKTKPKQEDNK